MKTVGIDIGSFSIKVAELEGSGSSIRVTALKEQPLSQKPGVDKELELITHLKEVISSYKAEETRFVLGLPQDRISTRVLQFPFKEKFKILKSLPFELEDQIPFSASDAVFEAKVIRTFPVGSEVLAVAAPKSLVKNFINLSADVQMDPEIISLEGFALNNLFEDLFAVPKADQNFEEMDSGDDEEDGESSSGSEIPQQKKLKDGEAVLDIGHSSSTLIVRSGGSLYNLRRINWGAKNLAQAISKVYNIQEMESLQNIKASKGILLGKDSFQSEDIKFSDALSEEINNLGQLLKWTLLEIKGANGIDVKGIGLLGGLSQLKNIGPKLTQNTLTPCNRVLKIKNHPELDLQNGSGNELSMGVAIGLGLEAFKRASNPPVNFRQDEFKKENSDLKDFWSAWGFYINLAAASIAVFFVYAFLRQSISEELMLTSKQNMRSAAESVFKMKKYNASVGKLKKLFGDLEQREKTKLEILARTKKQGSSPLNTLKRISEKASSKLSLPIDITKLEINNNMVQIQGVTSARSELQSFNKRLKALAVGKVNKTERNMPDEKISFSISFKPKKAL